MSRPVDSIVHPKVRRVRLPVYRAADVYSPGYMAGAVIAAIPSLRCSGVIWRI
jgi:hypothetical protein